MGVLDFLDWFDKPRNAVATATNAAVNGPDNASILDALAQGWNQEKHTSWGDVIGIPETTPQDDWGDWALKGGARLATDVVGDPLNLLFGTGAITKALGLSKAGVSAVGRIAGPINQTLGLSDKLLGSGLGKMFAHTSGNPEFENMAFRMQREGSLAPFMDQVAQVQQDLGKARDGVKATDLDIYQALERGTKNPTLKALADIVSPLQSHIEQQHGDIKGLLDYFNLPPGADLSAIDYTYMPHLLTEAAQRRLGNTKRIGNMVYDPNVVNPKEREIARWVGSPEAGELAGKELSIGKQKDARTLVKRIGNGDDAQYFYQGEKGLVPVEKQIADLKQVIEAFPERDFLAERKAVPQAPEGGVAARSPNPDTVPSLNPNPSDNRLGFVTDPVAALTAVGQQRQGQLNFLRLMKESLDSGAMVPIADMPSKGWRKLNVPGFEEFASPKPIANRLENMARVSFDPNTPTGMVGDLVHRIVSSPAGQTFQEMNRWFKSNVLSFFPGYHVGNLLSNFQQMPQAGVNPAMVIPRQLQGLAASNPEGIFGRLAKAITPSEIVPGLDQAALRQEMQLRGAIGGPTTQSQALLDEINPALQGEGRVRGAVGDLSSWLQGKGWNTTAGVVDKTGRTVARAGEELGRANRAGMQFGASNIEDPARMGVIIDYLKKNGMDFATLPPEAQAQLLDSAAQHGIKGLMDYGGIWGLTPTEKDLSAFFPFLAWNRLIAGHTANLAATRPQSLANLGRTLNTLTDPMTDRQKALADPWMREQGMVNAPTLAALTGSDKANPMAMLGRFIPQGNIEAMLNRPTDFAMSALSPWLKILYEGGTGKNTFKDADIDRLAGGGISSLINPLVGAPYETTKSTLFGQELPAGWDWLRGNLPGSRLTGLLNELGRSAGLWDDPYKQEANPAEGMAWGLSGGKIFPFDESKYLKKRQQEDHKKLNDVKYDIKRAQQAGDMKGLEHYMREYERILSAPKAYLTGA